MRIVGGPIVKSIKEFPYQVSIISGGHHFCGGALISHVHVLTAAHCIIDIVKRNDIWFTEVMVGSDELDKGQRHEIKRMSYHKDYDPEHGKLYNNDIAIIHVSWFTTVASSPEDAL